VTRPVRIGVLGCADIARRRMLPAFADCSQTVVTAIASRDRLRAEELARSYGCRAIHGYEALLADEDVDAVYVPLPAVLHADWSEAALRVGKHVLAEKPLTLEPERTAALFALARRLGLALMENVMFVHHPQHETVRRLVEDGAIGDVRGMRAEFAVPRRPAGDIRYRPDLGGGTLWDNGVYPLRAALHQLGPRLTVLGACLDDPAGLGADSVGAALLRGEAGATVQLTFGFDHGYRSAYEITGTRGRITVDHAFTPLADHRPALRLENTAGTELVPAAPADQVSRTVTAFAAAVRAGAVVAEQESVRQAELLAAIRRRSAADEYSGKEGRHPGSRARPAEKEEDQ